MDEDDFISKTRRKKQMTQFLSGSVQILLCPSMMSGVVRATMNGLPGCLQFSFCFNCRPEAVNLSNQNPSGDALSGSDTALRVCVT